MTGLSSRSASPFRLSCPSPTRKRLSLKGNPAYAPASAAQDLSRILDPAYATSQPRHSSDTWRPPSPVAAYVDHAGELHDPDFRDFPPFPLSASTSAAVGDRSPRSTSAMRSAPASRYALDACAAARGDDDDDAASDYRREESAWATPRPRRPYSASYANTPVLGHSPLFGPGGSPTLGGSPQSDASDEAPLRRASRRTTVTYLDDSDAEFDEDDPLGLDRPRRRRLHKWGRTTKRERDSQPDDGSDLEEEPVESEEKSTRKTRCPWRVSHQDEKPEAVHTEEKRSTARVDNNNNDGDDDDDDVPSCSYALRRQYLAFSLRIRTGVFHAKRRLRRRTRS